MERAYLQALTTAALGFFTLVFFFLRLVLKRPQFFENLPHVTTSKQVAQAGSRTQFFYERAEKPTLDESPLQFSADELDTGDVAMLVLTPVRELSMQAKNVKNQRLIVSKIYSFPTCFSFCWFFLMEKSYLKKVSFSPIRLFLHLFLLETKK